MSRAILFLALFTVCVFYSPFGLTQEKVNGFSLKSEQELLTSDHLNEVANTKANAVSVIPYAFANSLIPRLEWNTDWQWKGETLEGTAHALKVAKGQGFFVVIKPHIWLEDGGWVGDLEMLSANDWNVWWQDYANYIRTYALLADSLGVDMLVIGTEMRSTLLPLKAEWEGLIDTVRSVYNGQLTYAANWDDYQNVPFWDQLDLIGINAYFPCDSSAVPDVEVIASCLGEHAATIHKLSDSLDKKVLFTEFGFRSVRHAAWKQWELTDEKLMFLHTSSIAQVRGFLAFFKTFWPKPWVAGGLIWKWEPRFPVFATTGNGYSPQGKAALEVIEEWFGAFE